MLKNTSRGIIFTILSREKRNAFLVTELPTFECTLRKEVDGNEIAGVRLAK